MKQLQIFNHRYNIQPYLNRWYLFIISPFICLALASLYIKYATPIYRITSTLLVIDDKKGDGILKTTAFSDLNMFQETKTVDNEMEILRSKDLLERVFKKLNLGVSYFSESGFKQTELYGNQLPVIITIIKTDGKPILEKLLISGGTDKSFTFSIGKSSKSYLYNHAISNKHFTLSIARGPGIFETGQPITIQINDLKNTAASYSAGKLQVNPVVKESNTLRLTITDAIPQRGVDILTALIQAYNEENIEKKNGMVMGTLSFIDNRLKTLEQDLSGVEGEVQNYKQQNAATEISTGAEINLNKSADYRQFLESNNIQIGVIKMLGNYLNNSSNQFQIIPGMGLKDPVLNTLLTRFNELQLERNRMLNGASLTNPLVEELTEQINTLKQNIKENLASVKKGFLIEQNFLKVNSARYNSRLQSVPSLERGLLQRGREQAVMTNLYQYLLQKREETALSLSATIPSSQVIETPAVNPQPESPKTPLIHLLGGLSGLLLPLGLVYAADRLNPKVTTPSNVYQINGIKILGELTHHIDSDPIAISQGSTTAISELFRFIRMSLGRLDRPGIQKTILVTSCMKGEGKTFFSINLGLTLAQLNKKVLLLEFDLRQPDLLNKLQIQQNEGISAFLSGQNGDVMTSIQSSKQSENLYVLGCGPLPKNPAELLFHDRVELLFEKVKEAFDYVIIDTSPVGMVADAFSLSEFADLSVFLVRYNYTAVAQLQILKDINDHQKLGNMMVVLNDAKRGNRSAYAYGGYGYNQDRRSM